MNPLKITMRISGEIMGPAVHLDGLLAARCAVRRKMPPVGVAGDLLEANLAVLREEVAECLKWEGRFFLCSNPVFEVEQRDRRFLTRRFQTERAASLGSEKVRKIELSTGPSKLFRVPVSTEILSEDSIEWLAVGDPARIADLLSEVSHIGKKRSQGLGKVEGFAIEPVETQQEGFPVVHNEAPLRALPPDYPGLRNPRLALDSLCFPYWDIGRRVMCAVP